jgi:hypothetical protein
MTLRETKLADGQINQRSPRAPGISSHGGCFQLRVESREHMEKPMDRTPARDAIADEAVGETLESRAPDTARRAEIAAEEAARRFARSSGAQASIAEQTAESVGERVGDAYADAGSGTRRSGRPEGYQASPGKVAPQVTQVVSDLVHEQPFLMIGTCFALGYMTSALLLGRR